MVRACTLVLALWVFVLSMPLCVSGVVRHPCDEDHATDCSHETSCAQDPCALKITSSHSAQHLAQPVPIIVSYLPVVISCVGLSLTLGLQVSELRDLLPQPRYSYPHGTFPLLI